MQNDEGIVLMDRRGRPLLLWERDAKSVVKVPLGFTVEVSTRLAEPSRSGRLAHSTATSTHMHTHTTEELNTLPLSLPSSLLQLCKSTADEWLNAADLLLNVTDPRL